jgi:hypothetical protein
MPNTPSIINTDYVGQDFDDFLQQEGLAADVKALAIKKVVAALRLYCESQDGFLDA